MKPYVMKGNQIGTGAVDFSYLLDGPAGKYGFVTVKDGHFYFENGKRIRFFGVNLVFGAAMPEKERAVIIADRLASSGVNMVRLHHVDSYQLGDNTNTIIDYSENNSQKLHSANMDRMDFLISELKKRGIYIHIDLFTLRTYLPGDNLDYEDSLLGALKNVNYYNRRLIELHKKYALQYLTHRNPYTGLRYVDDPAVAVVQLLNENGIFWTNGEAQIPSYKEELDKKWNQWLLNKYKTRKDLDEAWTKEDGIKGLAPDEDPLIGTVKRPEIGFWGERAVDYRNDYGSIDGPVRFSDNAEFLIGIETEYINEMKGYLREIGVKCPVNASNLPAGAAELHCAALGDVTENNAYWNHPKSGFRVPAEFHMKEQWNTNPADPGTAAFQKNLVRKLAFAKVEGRPFIITEWNACYPTKFRAEAMLMLASYGCLQDWDGMLLFAYSESADESMMTIERMNHFFNSYNDPAIWGLAGVASAIFQGGLVNPGENFVELCYSSLDCFTNTHNADLPYGSIPFISRIAAKFTGDNPYDGAADMVINSGFSSTGDYRSAKHALVYARNPYGDKYLKTKNKEDLLKLHSCDEPMEAITDDSGNLIGEIGSKNCLLKDESYLDKDINNFGKLFDRCIKKWGLVSEQYGINSEGALVSDTGELKYDYSKGQFIIDADRVAAFVGELKYVKAGGFKLKIENRKASISILSRDGNSLKASKRLLIAAVGECVNENALWEGNVLMDEGTGPVLIDQIEGTMFLPSAYTECKAYALSQTGERREEMTVEKTDGGYYLTFDNDTASIYYEIIFE
jgi:hypothetical protein